MLPAKSEMKKLHFASSFGGSPLAYDPCKLAPALTDFTMLPMTQMISLP